MCVVALANIPKYGWVGVKNRDRNYKADIELVKSNRSEIERLYIDDKLSRWTEGLNEFGVCILNAAFSVRYDEREGEQAHENSQSSRLSRGDPGYYNKDGLRIRKALLYDNPKKAIEYLKISNLAGATYVFNKNECWLLEGGFENKGNDRKYYGYIKQITKDYSVRTNHGVMETMFGYKSDINKPKMDLARKSSVLRRNAVINSLKRNFPTTPKELLKAASVSPNDQQFFNPIRLGDIRKKEMATTGQLLLIPITKTLCYRPIVCKMSFDFQKLNNSKTNFEIVSNRKLLNFSNFLKK